VVEECLTPYRPARYPGWPVDGLLTIGELARAARVPVSTVRYYERRGLLAPLARSPGDYRVFTRAELERLRFIRAAQQNGFRLEDIRLLLDLRDGKGDPCGEVGGVIEARVSAVREQLAELERVRGVLERALSWCRDPQVRGRCRVLDDLGRRASDAD